MNRRFLLWGGLAAGLLLVIGFVIYMANMNSEDPVTADTLTETGSDIPELLNVRENDHIKGNPEADVVIIKYSDFQCPACRYYASFDDQLSREFGDDVLFVFRHFPLSSFQFSRLAARYAEAAGRQGKFWEMHDIIYINQQQWSQGGAASIFQQFGEALELDMEQLNRDLENPEIEQRIRSDYEDGIKLGVRSVPSIFIDGQLIQNPNSFDVYRNLIQSHLN